MGIVDGAAKTEPIICGAIGWEKPFVIRVIIEAIQDPFRLIEDGIFYVVLFIVVHGGLWG